jgi:hypothetical protein
VAGNIILHQNKVSRPDQWAFYVFSYVYEWNITCNKQWKSALKNRNSCWNVKFSFSFETSGGQNSIICCWPPVLIRHLWHLNTVVFQHRCLYMQLYSDFKQDRFVCSSVYPSARLPLCPFKCLSACLSDFLKLVLFIHMFLLACLVVVLSVRPFANGKEVTINRALDGSTYPS